MRLKGRRGIGWIALAVVLLVVAAMIVLVTANSIKQGAVNSKQEKLLIIFAEGMPYLRAMPNLDLLPNIKSLCDEGACFSMQPSSPTFTTMQSYVLGSNNEPKDALYEYNFIINKTGWKKNSCSIIGEITGLGKPGDYSLLEDIASKRRFAYYSIEDGLERYAATIFPALPGLLAQNDIVDTYITDTDSHELNLTNYSNPDSEAVQKLREFDALLGSLFSNMKKMGLYDNTNIIIYGDHGMAAINHFYYLDNITAELEHIVNLSDVCYWNDAGTSLRFWVLPSAESRKAEIKEKLSDYFSEKQECFYTVNDDVLASHNMLQADNSSKWINFGDVFIAVRPDCKVNTKKATGTGGMADFTEQQNRVDSYISMHGYIDNYYPELQAFVAVKLVNNEEMSYSNFTLHSLHALIKSVALGG
ncbi:MAG: alkaline phosphatase family protein [Candidatus Woesearchaeota archaeon]